MRIWIDVDSCRGLIRTAVERAVDYDGSVYYTYIFSCLTTSESIHHFMSMAVLYNLIDPLP